MSSIPAINVIINSTYNTYGPLWNRPTINSVDLCNVPWSSGSMVNAFYNCSSLTAVYNMNNTVTNMSGTYRECKLLTRVPSIPNSVTDISYGYYNCHELVNIPSIPSGIANMAYCFCNARKMIYSPLIPNSVNNVTECFAGCSSLLTTPNLPSSITSIVNTYRNCSSMTTVTSLPNSLTNMSNAFCNCNRLTDVADIPASVTNIAGAFDGCTEFNGTINILSNNITNAANLFANTSTDKYLKLHFYSSGTTETNTFSSLQAAGYNTTSHLHGVHLLDIDTQYYTLEVNSIPPESEITLTASGYTAFGNKISVPGGTEVSIDIIATDYEPYHDVVTVTKSDKLTIYLISEKQYKVDVTGYTYSYDSDSENLCLLKYTGSAQNVVVPEKELL